MNANNKPSDQNEDYVESRRERFEFIVREKREYQTLHIEWLKWLVLIGSAMLAFIVPVLNSVSDTHPSLAIRLSILFTSSGIVALSIRIYGYIGANNRVIKAYFDRYEEDSNKPVVEHIPKWIMWCEPIGYFSLIFSVIFLIIHSCS